MKAKLVILRKEETVPVRIIYWQLRASSLNIFFFLLYLFFFLLPFFLSLSLSFFSLFLFLKDYGLSTFSMIGETRKCQEHDSCPEIRSFLLRPCRRRRKEGFKSNAGCKGLAVTEQKYNSANL